MHCTWMPPDAVKVLEVFSELEFKNLTSRVLGGDPNACTAVNLRIDAHSARAI